MRKVKQKVKQTGRVQGGTTKMGKNRSYFSEPHRNRTCNLLIKSQLLFQLS